MSTTTKPVNQKAWLLVLPVIICVAFSAILPLMTVVNYSVQDIISPERRVFVGTEWFASVMPSYKFWEAPFYGIGLKMYDALAGSRGLGSTQLLSTAQVKALVPTVRTRGLSGGVKYWDGQFDDARLAVALARTAVSRGACVVNHVRCTALLRESGKVRGLIAQDTETDERFTLRATCVINATGVWVDAVRDMRWSPSARAWRTRSSTARSRSSQPRWPTWSPRWSAGSTASSTPPCRCNPI